MAAIKLDQVWVNDARNLDDYINCFTNESGFDEDDALNSESRTYAAGRTRTINRAGGTRTISCPLVELDRERVEWLRAHRGKLVLIRNYAGIKIWGTYPGIKPRPSFKSLSAWSVDLTITQITYREGLREPL